MEIIFVRRCKKSKQNSAKIIHRNAALKSTFSILLCNNSDQTCFSSHQHSLGSSGDVENLPRNKANVNARKNMFDPYIESTSKAMSNRCFLDTQGAQRLDVNT